MPNGVFVPYYVDPALVSGIIDGAAETVEMTVDLIVVLDCFKPTSFNAWLDNCKEKRAQIIDLLKSLRDLLKKETLEQIFKDFKEYVSETAGFDNQARYNQGRLIFEVASSFVGISEIKNALKGGNLVAIVSETLKKIPKDAIKIVTSTKKITSKTAKEIVQEVKNGLGKVDGKQIIFKSDFIKHLSEVVNFSQKKGVTGGHNLQKFEKYLIDNNIEINRISIVKGPIDGIIELTYQIKKTDSSGWKTQIFKKTLYDSKKISDTDMIKYGKEAIEEGIKNNRIKYQLGSNNIITGKSSNGIIFNGYQNPQTGEIINFHPIIE